MSQLPRISDLMVAPTQALLDAKPSAIKAAYTGRYADVLRGWEAQATRFRRYLAEECKAAKLRFAEDGELFELITSEFWAQIDPSPKKAIGEVILSRSGDKPAGSIRRGHRFARKASVSGFPLLPAAEFVVSAPVYVAQDVSSIEIPIEATVAGEAGNFPRYIPFDPEVALSSVDTLFDSAFVVDQMTTAGGASSVDNDWARAIAKSTFSGQFGPLDSALRAGAYSSMRPRRIASILDSVNARAKLFVADSSWASSTQMCNVIKQTIRDSWLGFGGAVSVLPIYNQAINIKATVTLKGAKYIDETSAIVENITKALKQYFDDRPDFYTFDNYTLRGLLSTADSRVLTCSSVIVLDAFDNVLTSGTLTENATHAIHYMLANDAVSVTFTLPS